MQKLNLTAVGRTDVSFAESWVNFREKYAAWLEPFQSKGPLYRVPAAITKVLAKSRNSSRPIMDDDDAKAEDAFDRLCHQHGIEGVWDHQPIDYRFLNDGPLPLPTNLQELANDLGWETKHLSQVRQAFSKTESIHWKLKGYVGWLMTEPSFREAVTLLSEHWSSLPASIRPAFPLGRVTAHGSVFSPELHEFHADLMKFLDDWQLVGLATWELPIPQGPLFANPQLPTAIRNPIAGVSVFVPLYYPVTSGDELLQMMVAQQAQMARQAKLDPSRTALPHFKAYARMVDVVHWERVVTERYGQPRKPQGFVSSLESALQDHLRLSADQVQRFRKNIAACLRGGRSHVRF